MGVAGVGDDDFEVAVRGDGLGDGFDATTVIGGWGRVGGGGEVVWSDLIERIGLAPFFAAREGRQPLLGLDLGLGGCCLIDAQGPHDLALPFQFVDGLSPVAGTDQILDRPVDAPNHVARLNATGPARRRSDAGCKLDAVESFRRGRRKGFPFQYRKPANDVHRESEAGEFGDVGSA